MQNLVRDNKMQLNIISLVSSSTNKKMDIWANWVCLCVFCIWRRWWRRQRRRWWRQQRCRRLHKTESFLNEFCNIREKECCFTDIQIKPIELPECRDESLLTFVSAIKWSNGNDTEWWQMKSRTWSLCEYESEIKINAFESCFCYCPTVRIKGFNPNRVLMQCFWILFVLDH